MTQKKINANIKTLLMWFKEDTDTFSKVYFRYIENLKKKFQNNFENKFEMLLDVWAKLSKTEYMHVLTIKEKMDKLEVQAMQFL